ncbi:MAG: formylglycine-generating enzyme family protein, partial [Cyanobacteria bacterium J06641_5]
VTVREFYLAKYPVTQAQWQFVAGLPQIGRELKPRPSNFDGGNRPVEQVSWYDAIEFCARLSRHTGQPYRLPSEAEWEYACRAGTTTPFHFGETITRKLVNCKRNLGMAFVGIFISGDGTMDVGGFPPNAFGLYDMHGNVDEWCADPSHDNYEGAPANDRVWDEKPEQYEDLANNLNQLLEDSCPRIRRGGSWDSHPRFCRSAYRLRLLPDNRYDILGFRVARSAPRT